MKTITKFDITSHGVDHAQYFPGVGVSFTSFTDCAVGASETAKDAFEDALEQLAMNDWDVAPIEESDEGKEYQTKEAEEASVHNYLVSQGEEDEERDDCCELYYYVSIRVA